METLSQKLADIEQQLANGDLYQAEMKENLTALLKDQAEYKKQLEEVELEWFSVQENMEKIMGN